ncbi:hypothetical protein RDWZM_001762 [Blomia tropicalis]|uniref:Alpha-amylase n=1 Tax=Blomia tropicalis TaxID=40697 RepID=A0A9Q0MF57_BLOTA|nr:hypothetical protein RDWZM_001762 [Blomia tropicalis]
MIVELIVFSLALTIPYQTLASSPYSDPHFQHNRKVITHLMQWKFVDIADECERFLGPYGYGGVQVSPVNEHASLDRHPWYELYQPVSYRIVSRSGTESQFRDMVHRCNKAGVRIYVDVVLNHMTGPQSGVGIDGTHYDGNSMQYPGIPFGPNDFHGHESCPTSNLDIQNYDDPTQARNCRLSGLRDLKQSADYVRTKQADFLNHLIDIGVAGFRFDASKHMWPGDLQAIYSKLHHLNEKYFPSNSNPFIYHEVIYSNNNAISISDYTKLGRSIEFHYYHELCNVIRGNNKLKWLHNFGQPWGMVPNDDALIMVDSHDLQRGHTGQLGLNINYFESRLLKVATAFMLAWPYGIPRVMSSYRWNQKIVNGKDENDWIGPPTDGSGSILSVKPNSDLTCNQEWICEHRWRQIYSMVQFRNTAGDEPVKNWWDNGDYQIAFSRGAKTFIAINLQNGQHLKQNLHTGLPSGNYCDLVTGNVNNGKCSGQMVHVDGSGHAMISIGANADDPFIALSVDARV